MIIAIDSIVALKVVPLFLAHPKLRPESVDRLIAVLSRHEAEALDPFATAIMGDYLPQREMVRVIEDRVHLRPGPDGRAIEDKLDDAGVTRLYRGMTGEPDTVGGAVGLFAKETDATFLTQLGPVGPPDRAAFAQIARMMLQASGKTFPEQRRVSEDVVAKFIGNDRPSARKLVILLCPDYKMLVESCAREAFYVRSMECLLALRRWQLTHDGLPSLEATCKDAKTQGVPIDPCSGAPLKLATIDGGLVVYSVAFDGVDDHALKDSDLGRKPAGDLLARMPKIKTSDR